MLNSVPAIRTPYGVAYSGRPIMFVSPIGSVYFVAVWSTICGQRKLFHEPMKLSSVYAPIIGRTIGSASSHHRRSSEQPSTRPAWSSSSGTCFIACMNRNMPNTLTAPGTMIAAYVSSQPMWYISSWLDPSSTCDGSSMVASMISMSGRLPAN